MVRRTRHWDGENYKKILSKGARRRTAWVREPWSIARLATFFEALHWTQMLPASSEGLRFLWAIHTKPGTLRAGEQSFHELLQI